MIEIMCGILLFISILLFLEDNFIKKMLGMLLFSNTINIVLLTCGRLKNIRPVFLNQPNLTDFGNPLVQALILTAIVIGFGILVFISVLIGRLAGRGVSYDSL